MLFELFKKQKEVGIKSEFVFANIDGSIICKSQYEQFVRRLTKRLNLEVNCHYAIRKYFNSFILIPAGIDVADRARIMGHSVETNLKYYTYEHLNYCDMSYEKLVSARNTSNNKGVTAGNGNV